MRSLHLRFRPEAFEIAIDGSDGENAALVLVSYRAVAIRDVAGDRQFVPRLGVADIVDRNVVVLTPEERHGVELLPRTEHVQRGGLALPLGDDPVLDAYRDAAVHVRPAS